MSAAQFLSVFMHDWVAWPCSGVGGMDVWLQLLARLWTVDARVAPTGFRQALSWCRCIASYLARNELVVVFLTAAKGFLYTGLRSYKTPFARGFCLWFEHYGRQMCMWFQISLLFNSLCILLISKKWRVILYFMDVSWFKAVCRNPHRCTHETVHLCIV